MTIPLAPEEPTRTPRPFPASHAEREVALITAAIAEAAREVGAVVKTDGIPHHSEGKHYAVFGLVAYTLQCELASDSDGWTWETIPAVVNEHLVGRWPCEEAGTILHLTRFVQIDGDYVIGARWEAAWIHSLWQSRGDVISDPMVGGGAATNRADAI
jgi:hypothetical protein